jgi:uncharacterized protein (TIGR03000 family)
MIRATAALALLLVASTGAWAQLIVRPPAARPQPAGVIRGPMLPFAGAPGAPSPFGRVVPRPQPFLVPNPFFNQWGFAPYWPMYYDVPPAIGAPLTRSEVNVVPAPATTTPPPAVTEVPVELRARLTLNIPATSQVWVAGQPVDAATIPLILESPVLEAGQRYVFDVKVVWKEGRKDQERQRTVTVDAGDSKSLTYTAAKTDGK